MLGLVLIYFVGKAFYDLAIEHEKKGWGYAILGVASYYLSLFIFAFAIAIISEYNGWNEMSDLGLTLVSIPFGVLMCFLTYRLLKRRFEKEPSIEYHDDLLDSDL